MFYDDLQEQPVIDINQADTKNSEHDQLESY